MDMYTHTPMSVHRISVIPAFSFCIMLCVHTDIQTRTPPSLILSASQHTSSRNPEAGGTYHEVLAHPSAR